MDKRDLEHPDVTAAQRTGYPGRAPLRVEVELDPKTQRAYIEENHTDFMDWCFSDPDIIHRYLEETDKILRQWVKEVLAG